MQPHRSPERTVYSCAVILIALIAFGHPVAAEDLTQPLTAEEVACNEKQIERLLQRMNAAKELYFTPQLPTTLLVSYSNSVGFYDGLLLTEQAFRLGPGEIPPTDYQEHYLAFNINPSIRTVLLNPGRPEIAQVSFNREQSSSNLVASGSYFDLILTLNPTLGDGDSLVINNFEEPAPGTPYNGFLANSTKPGRGLIADGLLTPCHQKLTDFDRHVFSVLQRMVRGRDEAAFFRPDMEFSIFRGEDPKTFRINFYPIYEHFEPGGRMGVELKMTWTPEGKLTTAVMKALPACAVAGQLGCTAIKEIVPLVFLIPPLFGGNQYYDGSADENGVAYVWHEGPSAPVTINLEALLAHTTWNEPVW
jgi:hypothetical protein